MKTCYLLSLLTLALLHCTPPGGPLTDGGVPPDLCDPARQLCGVADFSGLDGPAFGCNPFLTCTQPALYCTGCSSDAQCEDRFCAQRKGAGRCVQPDGGAGSYCLWPL